MDSIRNSCYSQPDRKISDFFWRLSFNHLVVVDLHTLSSRTVFAHLDNIGDDDGQHDEKGGKLDETKIISHQSAFGPFTKPHLSSLESFCMMLIVYVCLCLCMHGCVWETRLHSLKIRWAKMKIMPHFQIVRRAVSWAGQLTDGDLNSLRGVQN